MAADLRCRVFTFLHHPDLTHDLPDELLKAAVAVHRCDYLSCFRLMRPVV